MQKEPKQKRSEVPDEKLNELIKEYGNCRANEATAKCLVQQGGFSAKKGIIIARTNGAKAKQAIIDYHNKKIQEATKYVRGFWETHHQAIKDFSHVKDSPQYKPMFDLIFQDLIQAINKDLEGDK